MNYLPCPLIYTKLRVDLINNNFEYNFKPQETLILKTDFYLVFAVFLKTA